QYAGWIYVSDSDSGLIGWVKIADVRPGRSNPNQPPDGSLDPTPGYAPPDGAVFLPDSPTITPAPGTLTLSPMPLCQQYFVTAVRANIRACAGENCAVVERIEQNETVCIRGIMPNPDWLYIDLSPEETASELYAVSKTVVEPGASPRSAVRSYCEIYEVASSVRALARQCPSVTCPALDALAPGSWICVFGYGGEYQEWLQADIPNGARDVWVHGAAMRYRSDLVDTTPTPLGTEVSYALSQTPVLFPTINTPEPTAVAQNTTPTVPVSSVPACQPFLVSVSSAAVRECAATSCANMGVVTRGTELCVLGVNPENSSWYIVDMTPGDATDQVAYIGQSVVEPVGGVSLVVQEASLTPSPTAETSTPTNTVDPNLSPTPIFTGTPTVTLPPVFTLTPGAPTTGTGTITPTEVPIGVGIPVGPLTAHEITLAALRVRNIELLSPLGSTQFRFRVPDNWTPESSNILYLNFEYFEQAAENAEVESVLVSTFEVLMDGNLISTVTLNNSVTGPQVLAIPLPVSTLQNPRVRNHTIQLRLLAEDHCELNSQARIFIRSDQSYFHFEYRENSPVLNLAGYPRPLYNGLLPNQTESVVIVLPSEMSQTDLDAAARIASGIGLLTGNDLQMQIVTDETITPEQRQNFNLLLIGLPEENSLIQEFYERGMYPTQMTEDGGMTIEGVPVNENDGVVQIITNPLNPLRGVITATGQTPEALLKAAQSLGGPASIMGIGGPVTLIAEARPATGVTNTTINIDMTLADLGIDNIVLNGIGTQVAEISFTIPSGQRLTEEAYIEIYYNYSEILATGASTLSLMLNDEIPIASRQLSPDAGTGPFTLRGLIPSSGIVPGSVNTINVVLNASGNWQCDPPDDSITWFTISRDSRLHLPVQPIDLSTQQTTVSQFPFPFNDRRDLRDVFISLPEVPTIQDIEQTMKILAALGAATVGGEGFAPTVNLGELPPGIDLAAYHMIVIGRNTT
ncbi:MAG: cellulose biosynthesis cyclic di-GMP-binding regulatory protein BcsB, partial [Anaerolineae bacterium]|nr:cellulose biosynthesis cyclic di-GMP-binding regulatory protein BcsB [Anaerolineae bacterium]